MIDRVLATRQELSAAVQAIREADTTEQRTEAIDEVLHLYLALQIIAEEAQGTLQTIREDLGALVTEGKLERETDAGAAQIVYSKRQAVRLDQSRLKAEHPEYWNEGSVYMKADPVHEGVKIIWQD